MSRYDLVIFDWDGTLMDSTRLIARSLQSACRDVGAPVPSEREALFVIGLNLQDTFNHVIQLKWNQEQTSWVAHS